MEVVLLQTALPDYRRAVMRILSSELGRNFVAFCGESLSPVAEYEVKTALHGQPFVKAVRNHFLLGSRFWFQTGCFWTCAKAKVAILELNPRILSVWLLLLIRRTGGRRTTVWGHAWPRRGRGANTTLRDLMARLAGNVLTYTASDGADFKARLPRCNVYVAPNSLYQEQEIYAARCAGPQMSFIYVGRLVPSKKPQLLVRAFLRAMPDLPSEVRLVIVGDGPERQSLERIRDEAACGRIDILGQIDDVERLRQLYAPAIAAVSPGYAGLSVIQSFCFGVPILIARDEPHAPEIEAAKEGLNALFFSSDDADELAALLVKMARDRDHWLARRDEIAAFCRSSYSAEKMAAGFLAAIRGA
jgi:glycosyltransferase involved in cell wall biosynthesis